MGNITLSIPDSVQEDMKLFPEIRWSHVARQAIVSRIETLKMADNLAKKSKLTKKDVQEFGRMIKKNANKRFVG